MYSVHLEQLAEEQRQILRAVALAYRRVTRAPFEPAATRAEVSRRDQRRQEEALAAATAEYRRLNPSAPDDPLEFPGKSIGSSRRRSTLTPNGFGVDRTLEVLAS